MNDEPTYMSDYRRWQEVKCCDAGRTAYPDPCPWHDLGKLAERQANAERLKERFPAIAPHIAEDQGVTAREISDNEIVDAHVDVYARQVIVSVMELTLQQTGWKKHDLIDQTTWNRVRDRVHYILGDIAPEEQDYQKASVYLEEME
jgi:hypothetical protein